MLFADLEAYKKPKLCKEKCRKLKRFTNCDILGVIKMANAISSTTSSIPLTPKHILKQVNVTINQNKK